MIAEATTTEIESIEDLTLYSIDRSGEGITSLISGSKNCGEDLKSGHTPGINSLLPLVNALHDFDAFEGDICGLFNVDRKLISDGMGTLEETKSDYRRTLKTMEALLEKRDFSALIYLLLVRLPSTLDRFRYLLPELKTHIDKEYVQTEKQNA